MASVCEDTRVVELRLPNRAHRAHAEMTTRLMAHTHPKVLLITDSRTPERSWDGMYQGILLLQQVAAKAGVTPDSVYLDGVFDSSQKLEKVTECLFALCPRVAIKATYSGAMGLRFVMPREAELFMLEDAGVGMMGADVVVERASAGLMHLHINADVHLRLVESTMTGASTVEVHGRSVTHNDGPVLYFKPWSRAMKTVPTPVFPDDEARAELARLALVIAAAAAVPSTMHMPSTPVAHTSSLSDITNVYTAMKSLRI